MSKVKKSVEKNRPSSARMIRSLVIVFVLAVIFGLLAKGAMDMLNRKMGIENVDQGTAADSVVQLEDLETPDTPHFDPSAMDEIETGQSIWVPDWKATPCSIFVSGDSDALLDSLPQAPEPSERATELQLLIELWAEHNGYTQTDMERVWAFSSGDTCFIDLPSPADWDGIARTVEGRFISYTMLFPFVAGELVSGFEDGIAIRGIPSN